MTEHLTNKVLAWATEIATYAVQLPSRRARDDYLCERRRELVAGAQAEGATNFRHSPELIANGTLNGVRFLSAGENLLMAVKETLQARRC